MSLTPSPYEKFLKALRYQRTLQNLSQGDVAKRIKLSRAQYTAIENGRSIVNFVHLYNLSTALGVKFVVGNSELPFMERQ